VASTGSLLKQLACRACCTEVSADRPVGPCPTCGHTLLAEYELSHLDGPAWWKEVGGRGRSLWRYRELLPVRDDRFITTFGEGLTPMLSLAPPPGAEGLELSAKDDGGLPTGSFKARGMAVAISRARELGIGTVFVPSAGNAGLAAASYGARAGLVVRVYVPRNTPPTQRLGAAALGAEVTELGATLRETGEEARRREAARGAFDLSTLREPYRVEGKKTMGLEIVDTLGPEGLPDAIVYPTGGGTGLVGMFKAFQELRTLGLIDRIPRLYAVQPEGCAPVVRALRNGEPRASPWVEPSTCAPGLLVPSPFASERILEAVRESGGGGATVSDAGIREAVGSLAKGQGLSVSPEAAATFAALPGLCRDRALRPGERVLLYLTGSGLPFLGAAPPAPRAPGG
jgi:threonine synthase